MTCSLCNALQRLLKHVTEPRLHNTFFHNITPPLAAQSAHIQSSQLLQGLCRCHCCLCASQPFEFIAGEPINVSFKKAGDTAGGLFAGGSGPKPPPALSTAVIGMKPGGKVRAATACLGWARWERQQVLVGC